jgi:hypothetical protein
MAGREQSTAFKLSNPGGQLCAVVAIRRYDPSAEGEDARGGRKRSAAAAGAYPYPQLNQWDAGATDSPFISATSKMTV